jgi:curved DNA-binding protein CbpA
MPRVPRPLAGPAVQSLSLSQPEAYVLARVDALLDQQDLALMTGMTPDQVGVILDRLAQLGAIDIVDDGADTGDPGSAGPAEARAIPAPAASQPGARSPTAHLDFTAAPLLYDARELDEAIELEPDKKRRVLDVYYRLDELTYYELLGVGIDSDKKAIKSAYYAVAPEFHPDKFFRKQLGSVKAKIEGIFARITLAHDVLTVAKTRAEYDEYLEQTHRNRTTSAMLEQSKHDVAAILAAVEQAAAQAVAVEQGRAPAQAPGAPARAATVVSPEELLRQRRETLARRLSGGRKPVPAAPGSDAARAGGRGAVVEMDPAVAERSAEALRRRHDKAVADAKHAQVVRYSEAGRVALIRQDYAEAANSYRIAASLAPDDATVQAACNEALREVAAALADGYLKQASYEESQERWAEAALSYSKVCAGKPDNAGAHERVAFATVKSGGNARRAVEFARKAIELDPKKPEYRVTLARAYGAAGLEQSAASELDRARDMALKDPKIQSLVSAARAAIHAPKDAVKDVKETKEVKEAPPPSSAPKVSGFSGFLRAVRSAIAPKESK